MCALGMLLRIILEMPLLIIFLGKLESYIKMCRISGLVNKGENRLDIQHSLKCLISLN